MKTTKEEVERFISQLEIEADACEEIGSSFSASNMRDEADRLKKLLAAPLFTEEQKKELKDNLKSIYEGGGET